MSPYADSNFLVRIYYSTPFSAEVAALLESLDERNPGPLPPPASIGWK